MWSLGYVVFVCFTGDRPDDSYLIRHHAMDTQQSLAQWQSHLAILLKQSPTRVSRRATSFIHSCLVIREDDRLVASAAALHPWFTCALYVSELRLAYDRAVSAWTPRLSSRNLVERCEVAHRVNNSRDNLPLAPLCATCETSDCDGPSTMDFVPPRSTQMPVMLR